MIKSANVPISPMEILVSRRTIQPGACEEAVLPQWVLGLALGGAMEQGQPKGKRFVVHKGDLAIVRGHTPQRWRVLGKSLCHGIDCIFDPRPHWISWLNWPEIAPGFMLVSLRNAQVLRAVRAGMMRAHRLGKSGTPQAMEFVYNEIEKALLLVNEYYRRYGPPAYDPRVSKAIKYLTDNLAAHMGLKEVAAYCGLSRTRTACLFKQQVGCGPVAFQNEQRITRAKQMLRLSFLSIKEIALDLGFKNPYYFSTCFRRLAGVSPRQYRRKRYPGNSQKNRRAPSIPSIETGSDANRSG